MTALRATLIERFTDWAVGRSHPQEVVSFDGKHGFNRYAFLWLDEFTDGSGRRHFRPPWWRPFNILLHHWNPEPGYSEEMHDHPRWSISICIAGKLIEHTPWGDRTLTPGSVVIRSRKAIHGFSIPDGYSGKTWTLFIVGRRNHAQNTYAVTARGVV
jgi:hypothetical protein